MIMTSKMVHVDRQTELAVTFYETDRPSPDTILFCHGLGGTQACFKDDAAFFAHRGFNCLTIDLRGFGRSSRLPDPAPEELSLERFARDIIELLDTAKLRPVHFIGNSLGGVVGLEIIRLWPNPLSSLVTLGTTYHLDVPAWMVTIQNAVSSILGQKALAYFAARSSSQHEHTRRIVREMFLEFPQDIGRLVSKNIAKYDYRDVAGHWERPILLLTGDHDWAINRRLATTLAALSDRPNCDFQMIPDAGHFTNLDNPASFRQAILSFLEWIV